MGICICISRTHKSISAVNSDTIHNSATNHRCWESDVVVASCARERLGPSAHGGTHVKLTSLAWSWYHVLHVLTLRLRHERSKPALRRLSARLLVRLSTASPSLRRWHGLVWQHFEIVDLRNLAHQHVRVISFSSVLLASWNGDATTLNHPECNAAL